MDESHRKAEPNQNDSTGANRFAGMSAEDTARVEHYLVGNGEAFREVDGWIRIELRRCYSRLSGEFDDLCQTAHEKLFVELSSGRFEGRSSLRSYLSTIVHRTAVNRLRRLYRDRALSESLLNEVDTRSDNPYRQIMIHDEVRLAHRVVMEASATCRELWRLVFAEKLGYEEVARRVAIPPGTVKSRMWHCRSAARKTLRRLRMLQRMTTRSGKQKL